MSKVNCPCGNQLSNVCSPSSVEGYLLSGYQRDVISDDGQIQADKLCSILRDVWECQSCGRLAIAYPSRGDRTLKWYKPEDNIPGKLFDE